MHSQRRFNTTLLTAKTSTWRQNVTWAPPPGFFSCVLVHAVDEVIVQSYEVADESRGAQACTLSLWQQHLKVTVDVQVLLAELGWNLNLTWKPFQFIWDHKVAQFKVTKPV